MSRLVDLTILTPPRPTPLEYTRMPIGTALGPTSAISSRLVSHLARTPLLTVILFRFLEDAFPCVYDPDFVTRQYAVPPSLWESTGHRGMIIRQYANPSTGEELWHMRALSRVVAHKSGQVYLGVERSWRDLTRFEGQTVPREVLQAAGAEMGFLEGGRGLDLDSEVWTALRQWRGGVGV